MKFLTNGSGNSPGKTAPTATAKIGTAHKTGGFIIGTNPVDTGQIDGVA